MFKCIVQYPGYLTVRWKIFAIGRYESMLNEYHVSVLKSGFWFSGIYSWLISFHLVKYWTFRILKGKVADKLIANCWNILNIIIIIISTPIVMVLLGRCRWESLPCSSDECGASTRWLLNFGPSWSAWSIHIVIFKIKALVFYSCKLALLILLVATFLWTFLNAACTVCFYFCTSSKIF